MVGSAENRASSAPIELGLGLSLAKGDELIVCQVAENLWNKFTGCHLTEKVRCEDGSQFSEILTQIG